jgi:hypothetical protein
MWWRFTGLVALAALALVAAPGAPRAQDAAYGSAAAELAEQIARAFPKVSGQVIAVEAERVLVDVAKKDQSIPGLELQVFRPGQEFKHPYTGQVLGKLDRDVARIRILEVHEGFSAAEIIQQAEGTMVQQGDLVRVPSARAILALPNVDVSDVAGANTRSVTRDLLNALVKTNRFEVMPDQRLRAAVAEEKLPATDQFTDPVVLQALWKRLRVSAVLLAKLSLQEQAVHWDVQVISTVRGDSITLATAEVKGVTPKFATAGRGGGTAMGRDAPRIDQIAMRGQELPFKAHAMTVGNLTGDGARTVAITDGQGVYVYELERGGIKLLWSRPGETRDNVLSVDAADINQNGVDEIFVTNYTTDGRLRSYVVEFQKTTFVRSSEEIPLHFRVMQGPAGTTALYGQAAGDNKPFDGPVRRYGWREGRYAPAEAVALPKPFAMLYDFGFADLDGDGAAEVLVLDQNDYLRVFDRGGNEMYRSSDRFGGSERVVEWNPQRAAENNRTGIEPERRTLQARIAFLNVTGEGKRQVVLPKNTPSTGYMFKTRLYDRGRIVGLAWDGMGMQAEWETRELPGYVADFGVIQGESGERQLVVLVVQTNLIGVTKSRSTVILLDLKAPA